MRVDPVQTTLAPGDSYAFTVRGRYSDGTAALSTDRATWSVDGDGAATIDDAGRATAVRPGAVSIVASVRGLRGTARLVVSADAEATPAEAPQPAVASAPAREETPAPVLQRVVIEPPADTLRERDRQRLTAWGRYSDGTVRDITREAVWSSSDVQVARVAADGTVVAVRYGAATIAATLQTYSGAAAMTVEPVVARIAIRPRELALLHRAKLRVYAVATLTNDRVRDVTSGATWTSSDERVAVVRDGVVEGLAPGRATITATLDDVRVSEEVTVAPIVESIALQPQFATLAVGQGQQMTATATLSDGSTQDVTTLARWSSDSPAARVSPTGMVTAIREGAATVRVRVEGAEAFATISVTRRPDGTSSPYVP